MVKRPGETAWQTPDAEYRMTFNAYLRRALAIQKSGSCEWSSRNRVWNQVCRSMYSTWVQPWLEAFEPGQLVFVLMGEYFEASAPGSQRRRQTLKNLDARLRVLNFADVPSNGNRSYLSWESFSEENSRSGTNNALTVEKCMNSLEYKNFAEEFNRVEASRLKNLLRAFAPTTSSSSSSETSGANGGSRLSPLVEWSGAVDNKKISSDDIMAEWGK